MDNRSFFRGRTIFLTFIFLALIVIVLFRFFYLQVINGDELKELREKNINTFEYVYPKRGRIISKDGFVLAEDRKIFSIAVNLNVKPNEQAIEKLISIFPNKIENQYVKDIVEKSIKTGNQEVIVSKLNQQELSKFLVRSNELEGFSVIENYERIYDPHPSIFHVLGHMGYLSERDKTYFKSRIDQYTPSLWRRVGKSGVERIYEEQLRGKHGKRFFLRNARGQKKVEIGKEDFIEGSDLNISINFNAQKKAYDLLNGRKGSIVVLDLRDFSIPVAVSAPSISANDLRDISSKEYQALLNDTKRPLFNRAFMGLYPPGSTIKPFFTIFALSNSYTNWQEQIYDDGFFRFAESGRVFNAWREGGHGLTNLNKALVESSNPFFMNLATRYEKDSFTDFLDSGSFGKRLCVDCWPHQFSPLISDQWKTKNFGSRLFRGDLVNMGVGQGYLSVTPLHLALISAMIAKKGDYEIPYLVQKEQDIQQLNFDLTEEDWKQLHESLTQVIYSRNGTGIRIQPGDMKLAGKTGTAQVKSINSKEEYDDLRENEEFRDHAMFIGFAPYDEPRYAISVVIENGEWGGSVAGPVARDVLLEVFNAD